MQPDKSIVKGQQFKIVSKIQSRHNSHFHHIGDIVTFTGEYSAISLRPQMQGLEVNHYTDWEDLEPLTAIEAMFSGTPDTPVLQLYPSLNSITHENK